MPLPESIRVFERGWLSSNNILFLEGDAATLVDTGYGSHAAQTVALVERGLEGRQLARILNTHAHSDHVGGNLALQERFGATVAIPAGVAPAIEHWDEAELLYEATGQQVPRFRHDFVLHAGDDVELGGDAWQLIAAPGHDMEALAFHSPERRILIPGDALWRDGFGVIFPEVFDDESPSGLGFAATRSTLEAFARLPVDVVIPGHGEPFEDVAEALERAFRRLASYEADPDRLARFALKSLVVFLMLELRELPRARLPQWLAELPVAERLNSRFLHLDPGALADWLAAELIRSGSLREEDGMLRAAGR